MRTIKVIIHQRGISKKDIHGEIPETNDAFWSLSRKTNNFGVPFPHYVEDSGITILSVTDDGDVCLGCDGEGRYAVWGTGDQAGGYAQTCDDCNGTGKKTATGPTKTG